MGKLIPRAIPTIYGGVTRQPHSVRRPNQVEEGKNALFSVVTGGFEKRPGTQHVAQMTTLDNTTEYRVHPIDRDSSEQYFVLLDPNGEIYVIDTIDGSFKTVTIGDSTRYFLVEATNIDATGLLDTVSLSDAQSFGFDANDAYRIFHDDTQFDWEFKCTDGAIVFDIEGSADGIVWNDIATGKTGTSGSFSTTVDAVAAGDHNYIRVEVTTAAGTADDHLTLYATFKDKTYLYLDVDGPEDYSLTTVADYTFIVNRNHVARLAEADIGTVTDVARSTVVGTPPAGLPAPTATGNIYKVIDDNNEFTSYYVIDDTVEGVYVEYPDPNAHNAFDQSSLPHQLLREADGSFTFSASNYLARGAGDELLTPAPKFIGETVSDVVFFRERLGFLAGESIYLSRTGFPFSMWPEKAITQLDTDPVEREARATDVNILKFATVFRKLLFCTGERAQWELTALEKFTPTTAAFDRATAYPASPVAPPQPMGDVLYFPSSGQSFTTIYEYFFDESQLSNTAADVTKHVIDYVPNDVLQMAADAQTGTLFALSTGAQNKLYVYRTFFDGTEKIQSSWAEYVFGATEADAFIHGISVFSGFLVMLIERGDGFIYVEQTPIDREASNAAMGYIPLVDQRQIVTGTYVSAHECTYWDPTWSHSDDAEVVLGPNFTGDDIGRRMTLFYPPQKRLVLVSVAAGETLVVDDGTTSQTYTAHATTTTTANREFSISGSDAADAGELVTCINDATDGHPTISATDLGAGIVRLDVDDPCDGLLSAPTGTAIDNATISVTDTDQRVAARGEHDDDQAYIGRVYTLTVELSKQYMREDGDSPAILDGRLQIRDITFSHENTGYYKVAVTPLQRTVDNYEFTGRTIGETENQIGSAPIDDRGTFMALVNSNGETVKIEVINDTPFPSVITAATWRGFFNEITRQG
jgi:hypothetical protein